MMLSKMKTAIQGPPASLGASKLGASSISDNEEDEDQQLDVDELAVVDESNNDNNNNNNSKIDNNNSSNNINNNNNNKESSKKNEDELLEIIEVSRKRRLSKSSADSLTSFIRWSFTHLSNTYTNTNNNNNNNNNDDDDDNDLMQIQSLNLTKNNNNITKDLDNIHDDQTTNDEIMLNNNNEDDDDDEDDNNNDSESLADDQQPEVDHWNFEQRQLQPKSASASSNGAFLKAATSAGLNLSSNNNEQQQTTRSFKKLRSSAYSPELPLKFGSQTHKNAHNHHHQQQQHNHHHHQGRSSTGHLGSVVDRIHQQQVKQQQSIEQQQQQQQQQDSSAEAASLSYHLQQFLQQQFCNSVGLEATDNNQLMFAAAIHKAIVESAGSTSGNQMDLSKQLTGSSTSGSSSAGSSQNYSLNLSGTGGQHQQQQQLAQSLGQQQTNNSAANLHLIDSLQQRSSSGGQRRAYNTRQALHQNLSSAIRNQTSGQQQQQQHPHQHHHHNHHQHHHNQLLNNTSLAASRAVQQQRHAQAAAALSALAAGSQLSQQQLGVSSSPLNPTHTGQHLLQHHSNSIVDFKCDTCGSSFDDRHRLMQHQSIHLELKKDWFTETPVDEVMKIFNRRRGEFLCNLCNLRFEATLDYDQHNHQVHGPRPYCCQFCGNGTRTFKCWRQYLNHLYDHRYVFSCTIEDCDFTVNRRDSLRFHIFRFHLNCQLPQNVIGNSIQQQQNNLLLNATTNNNGTNNNSLQSRVQSQLMLNSAVSNADVLAGSKWPINLDELEDEQTHGHEEDDDTENEMNVAD